MAETRTSIWRRKAPETSYPPLSQDVRTDVAVIGGGITGLTTAFLLSKEGLSVVLLEAQQIGSGATGNTTAKLTSLHRLIYNDIITSSGYEAAKVFAEANQAAIDQIEALVRDLKIDCHFARRPAYTFTTNEAMIPTIEKEVLAAQSAGLKATYVDSVSELPLPVRGAIQLAQQAHFDPYRYCCGLAKAFKQSGGQIFENTQALDVKNNTIETQLGQKVRANHVILATQIPFLDRSGAFVRNSPMRSYVLSCETELPALNGMYISAEDPIRSLAPAAGHNRLLIGGESHKTGQEPRTQQRYEELAKWSHKYFPVKAIEHQWSSQDYLPADHLPYIGPLGRLAENVYIATGYGKWGLTRGTFAAMILRDQILQVENPWSERFSATRLHLKFSAKKIVKENVNVAKRFFGDRLGSLNSPPSSKLSPGEAGVVRDRGTKQAVYRDDDGHLHKVSPVCTHLGCHLTWNEAEKSWDCPCHGSRFDIDGTILQGPAVQEVRTHL